MDMSSCLASACSEGFVKGLEARVGNSTAQVCYKAYIDSKQYELLLPQKIGMKIKRF